MRTLAITATLMLALAAGGAASAQQGGWSGHRPPPNPGGDMRPPTPPRPQPQPQPGNGRQELTLYEFPDFGGRQYTWYGPTSEIYRQGYAARSARSTGGWLICERPSLGGRCLNVAGQLRNIDQPVASASPNTGTQQLTLFEFPDFRGRQYTWYGPSNQIYYQGFQAQSVRSAGVWTVCEKPNLSGRCRVVEGSMRDLGQQVASATPGRANTGGPGDGQGGGGQWGGGGQPGGRDGRTQYACSQGVQLNARFDGRSDTVELRSGYEAPVTLQRTRSDTGFRYASRDREFYGDGRQATYLIGRRAPITCRAVND